jgi:hypothetical protein
VAAKSVHVIDESSDLGVLQSIYYEPEAKWLRPDLYMVDRDGNMLWQTNALRLRGPDVEPDTRIGVVWGDSVVFCVYERSWPEMLSDFTEDCVFLNGGVEGVDYITVLEHAIDFNVKHRAAVNVILTGWEPMGVNSALAGDLRAALKSIPNAVLVTMPTSLNAQIINMDIRGAFISEGDWPDIFGFLGKYEYSVPRQQALFTYICERNDIVRTVARETGTPLVDLFAALDSRQFADFRECFFDVSHPRPSAYKKIASIVWETVGPLLAQ